MLLSDILQALDDELDRLHKLRAIIARLQHSVSAFLPPSTLITEPTPASDPVPTITRLPPRKEPTHRFRKPRQLADAPRALSANIPTAPVVITPIARHTQPDTKPAIAVEPGSFGAMVRAAERGLAN